MASLKVLLNMALGCSLAFGASAGLGCRGSKPPAGHPNSVSASSAPSINLTDSKAKAGEATYTWTANNVSLVSATIGSTTLQAASNAGSSQIILHLQEDSSRSQITATLTLNQDGTSTNGSSNIGMAPAPSADKLVVPVPTANPAAGSVMLAKGQGAFPSLTVTVKS